MDRIYIHTVTGPITIIDGEEFTRILLLAEQGLCLQEDAEQISGIEEADPLWHTINSLKRIK